MFLAFRLVDLAIDQEFPSVQEAMVARVTPKTVDFRVHPDTRYGLASGGKPLWIDADGRQNDQPNVWKLYDPATRTIRGAGDPFSQDTMVEQVGPSLLRCHLENTFESSRLSPQLVTIFGSGDVRIEGNKLSSPDRQGTVLHGQMESGEIRVESGSRWHLRASE